MGSDVVDQPFLILPHLEKIIVLTQSFDGTFTIRTEAIGDILFRPEPLIVRAIPSRVVCLVNQLFIVQLLKVSLNHGLMLFIRGADEGVIGNVQPLPEVCELRREAVAVGLRVDTGFGRGLLDLLPVFIQTGQEKHVAST